MLTERLTHEALELSSSERATLARLLWQSLEDADATPAADIVSAAITLANERAAELTAGSVTGIPHDQVMREARSDVPCN